MPIQKSQLNILLFYQRDTKTHRRSATHILSTQIHHQPTGAELALDCRENADADTSPSTSCTCRGEGALVANRTAKVEQSLACRERELYSLNKLQTLERNSGCGRKW